MTSVYPERRETQEVHSYLQQSGIKVVWSGDQCFLWDALSKLPPVLPAIQGSGATLVKVVHNVDYFSKSNNGQLREALYVSPDKAWAVVVQNGDRSWVSAVEFARLFGSEAPLSLQELAASQMPRRKLNSDLLKQVLSSEGWYGLVGVSNPIAAEVRVRDLLPALAHLFRQGAGDTARLVKKGSPDPAFLERLLDRLPLTDTLTEFYQVVAREVLPRFTPSSSKSVALTSTAELFRLAPGNINRPRFTLARIALNPELRPEFVRLYNKAVASGPNGIYSMDKYEEGAIPFDLYLPGQGRYKLRLAEGQVILDAGFRKKPRIFVSIKKEVRSVEDLSQALTSLFPAATQPPVLVPTAVTLLPSLLIEGPLLLNKYGSSYTEECRLFLRGLLQAGLVRRDDLHKIIRIEQGVYDALEALGKTTAFTLPEELAEAFGLEEITAQGFARRWREVSRRASNAIEKLLDLRSPAKLLDLFAKDDPCWRSVLCEYTELSDTLADEARRRQFTRDEEGNIRQAMSTIEIKVHEERLRRLRRHAIARSLEKSNHRPYWPNFFIVDPSGRWLSEAVRRAVPRLEDLSADPDEQAP